MKNYEWKDLGVTALSREEAESQNGGILNLSPLFMVLNDMFVWPAIESAASDFWSGLTAGFSSGMRLGNRAR